MQELLKVFVKQYTNYIFHITHKDNLENILRNGLLAHNNNLVKNRIDNIEVNNRRNKYIKIRSKYWTNFEDGKRIKMSEVLVPKRVKIKHLKKIYVNNQNTKKYIDVLLNNLNFKIDSKINRKYFF